MSELTGLLKKVKALTFSYLRCCPKLGVLDLPFDCDLPWIHLHLHHLSNKWMVCTQGKIKNKFSQDTSMSYHAHIKN